MHQPRSNGFFARQRDSKSTGASRRRQSLFTPLISWTSKYLRYCAVSSATKQLPSTVLWNRSTTLPIFPCVATRTIFCSLAFGSFVQRLRLMTPFMSRWQSCLTPLCCPATEESLLLPVIALASKSFSVQLQSSPFSSSISFDLAYSARKILPGNRCAPITPTRFALELHALRHRTILAPQLHPSPRQHSALMFRRLGSIATQRRTQQLLAVRKF